MTVIADTDGATEDLVLVLDLFRSEVSEAPSLPILHNLWREVAGVQDRDLAVTKLDGGGGDG